MLERLLQSLLLLAMAGCSWLAAWAGRRVSRGLSTLLGFLGGLTIVLVLLTLVRPG
jgi:hypothetical protein